uniref:Uncharacterized protein n=1 Tax=Arundo donax TaxID=35708 RepID=A0A0A8ZN69_ARUDO
MVLGVGKELLLGSFSHLPHARRYKRGSVSLYPCSIFSLFGSLCTRDLQHNL